MLELFMFENYRDMNTSIYTLAQKLQDATTDVILIVIYLIAKSLFRFYSPLRNLSDGFVNSRLLGTFNQ